MRTALLLCLVGCMVLLSEVEASRFKRSACRVSERKVAKCVEMSLDENHDQKLSGPEIQKALDRGSFGVSEKEVMAKCDHNNDGVVTLKEFESHACDQGCEMHDELFDTFCGDML